MRDAPDAFAGTLQSALAQSDESWLRQLRELPTFVAVINEADVGIVRIWPTEDNPGVAYLVSMWVAPDSRGMCVGERLIGAAIGWSRSAGLARLLLDVADENKAAITLYERMGFVTTGMRSTLPPPREHIKEHQRALDL